MFSAILNYHAISDIGNILINPKPGLQNVCNTFQRIPILNLLELLYWILTRLQSSNILNICFLTAFSSFYSCVHPQISITRSMCNIWTYPHFRPVLKTLKRIYKLLFLWLLTNYTSRTSPKKYFFWVTHKKKIQCRHLIPAALLKRRVRYT